jgi:RHS repeat-associated protein
VTTTGPAGTHTDSYGYDSAGDTTSRSLAAGNQGLTWDAEGHLATATISGQTTTYVYDADGNRLVERDPNGTTVYFGAEELRWNKSTNAVTGTRYYSWAGQTIGVRTGSGSVSWLSADQLGTSQLTIASTGQQAATVRYNDPYGAPRGTPPTSWPDTHGYLGKPVDAVTGLTHLGARDYDPTTGRFTSPDPVLNPDDPQSLSGYDYAGDNPTTTSDPTGLYRPDGGGYNEAAVDNFKEDHPNLYPGGSCPKCPPARKSGGLRDAAAGAFDGAVDAALSVASPTASHDSGLRWARKKEHKVLHVDSNSNAYQDAYFLAIAAPAFLVPGGEAEVVAEDSLSALQTEIHEAQAAARAERAAQEAEQAAKAERVTPKEGPARPSSDEPSCTHSFDPSTPVLMADGSHKAIKDVKVGDEVLTTDPTTGKTVIEKVTALHDNHDTDLADITVADAAGKTTVLHTTWHHPLYNADTHTFTEAADLTPGTNLYTLDHQRLRVVSVRTWTGLHDMRDLTIAKVHTYYIIVSTIATLVHNCGGGLDASGAPCTCPSPRPATWTVDAIEHPDSAIHAAEQGGEGMMVTLDRAGAAARRAANLHNIETIPGLDRDEFPPAIFKEGANADVKHIIAGDNRGAGSSMRHQLRGIPNGGRVMMTIEGLDYILGN